MSKNDTLQDDAISYIDSFLTPEEIAESNLRVTLIANSSRRGMSGASRRSSSKR